MGNGRRGTGSRTPGNAWEALPAGNRVGSTDTMDSQLSADDRAAAPDEPANVEATLRELAETIGAVFWLTDWKTRTVLYASPKWERLWGVPREALFSEDPDAWASAIHPEDRQRVLESFRSRGPQGEYEEDFRIVHPDGSVRWLHERAYPVRDERGAVLRIAGVAWDDTKRKEAERSLVEEADEARFASSVGRVDPPLGVSARHEEGVGAPNPPALMRLGRDPAPRSRGRALRTRRRVSGISRIAGRAGAGRAADLDVLRAVRVGLLDFQAVAPVAGSADTSVDPESTAGLQVDDQNPGLGSPLDVLQEGFAVGDRADGQVDVDGAGVRGGEESRCPGDDRRARVTVGVAARQHRQRLLLDVLQKPPLDLVRNHAAIPASLHRLVQKLLDAVLALVEGVPFRHRLAPRSVVPLRPTPTDRCIPERSVT